MIPFFDVANIGMSSGSVDEDAAPLRLFVDMQIEFFVAQSFSKNFGLYNERVGNLVVFSQEKSKMPEIKQYLHGIARTLYTSPPLHVSIQKMFMGDVLFKNIYQVFFQGARVVSRILQANYHKQEWAVQVKMMYARTQRMRKALRRLLEEKQTPGTWHHITESSGLFLILGLNERQINYLEKKHNIYTGSR